MASNFEIAVDKNSDVYTLKLVATSTLPQPMS